VLRWLPAVDDATAHAQIRYFVLQGSTAETLSTTPVADVTGATEIAVGSLTADTGYYFQVVAEDEDGTRSIVEPAVLVTTLDTAVVVNKVPKDVAGLGLSVVENGLNDFTLSGAGATGIVADDLIIIDNTFGRSLRRVVSSTPSAGDNNIITAKASMDEVFDGGSLRTSGVLTDPVGVASSRRRVTLWSPTAVIPKAPQVNRMATANMAVETRAAGKPTPIFHAPVSIDSGITLDYDLGFKPSFETDIKYDDTTGRPKKLRAVAKGKFTLDAIAAYNLTVAAQVKKKVQVFSKKITFTYAIGTVPVVQDVELKVFAEVDFNFEGAIDATANLHAEKTLAFGFQWTEALGFQLIKEEGFDRTITYGITGQATAKGALKITPVLSTTLYKVATAALSVSPTITLDAKARLLPVPPEITKFDVTFFVGAKASADLTILGLTLLKWESDEYRLLEIPIHSQPELNIRASSQPLDTCGKRKIYLQVADGYNNSLDLSSVQWSVDPPATITVGANPLIVDFEAATAGTYAITASGNGQGFLGALGIRYANYEITVVDAPPGDCNPVNSEGNPVPFQCLTTPNVGLGLFGAPTLNKTLFAPGDTFELRMPACEGGCSFKGWMNNPNTSVNHLYNVVLHDPPHGASGFAMGIAGAPDAPAVVSYVLPPNIRTGAWEVGPFQFTRSVGSFEESTSYGGTSGGSVFTISQYHTTPPYESCLDQPTSFPALYFNVIADDERDGNEGVEENIELPINGGKTVHTATGAETDWFSVAPTTEGGYGAAFDSDITYDPECYVTVTVTNAGNAFDELCAYRTVADADAKTNPIVCFDGPITFQTTADQRYYLSVESTTFVQTYEIEAVSNCDDPLAAYSRMTTTPQLSANPVTIGAFVDTTVDFTPNTTQLRVDIRTTGNSAGSTQNVPITPPAIVGVASYETWNAWFNTQYDVKVTLDSVAGHRTIYSHNPAVSTVNYTVDYYRSDGFEINDKDSGIPLVFLQTN